MPDWLVVGLLLLAGDIGGRITARYTALVDPHFQPVQVNRYQGKGKDGIDKVCGSLVDTTLSFLFPVLRIPFLGIRFRFLVLSWIARE